MGRRVARRDHAEARPRRRAHTHRPRIQGLGGRRRVQRRARPEALLRDEDDRRHRVRRQSRGEARRGLHAPGRRRHQPRRLAQVRRRRARGPQRPQLRGTRLRLPRRAELRRQGADRRQPAEARRHRLGRDLRRRGRQVVPHRRDIRRALRDYRRGLHTTSTTARASGSRSADRPGRRR